MIHKLPNYKIDTSGTTESIVDIQLLEIIESLDIKIVINEYKISNFFKGKFFIKRLINKIFKYKLNKKMIWNSIFWDSVKILNIKISIKKSAALTKETLESHIEKKYKKNRVQNIYYYKNILDKIKNPPLYIDGYSLNILGADTKPHNVFMLDGARRIIAHLLNGNKNINIYLISANA